MPGVLTHSPADVIRQLLIQLGAGTDPSLNLAWPVFAAGEPSLPDNCITVSDTAGKIEGRSMIDGESLEHEGIQVRVRSATHRVGYEKANYIATHVLDKDVYENVVTIEAISYLVHNVTRTGGVLPLGKEVPSSKRSIFTTNAITSIRQLPLV